MEECADVVLCLCGSVVWLTLRLCGRSPHTRCVVLSGKVFRDAVTYEEGDDKCGGCILECGASWVLCIMMQKFPQQCRDPITNESPYRIQLPGVVLLIIIT